MDRPRCGHSQVFPDAAECERCGVIFARLAAPEAPQASGRPLGAREDGTPHAPVEPAEPAGPPSEAAGWRALAVGAALALASSCVPLLGVLIGMFVVLAHEMGHALAGWLFARPSLPAFDFVYGGGVTAHLDRSLPLLLAIYALFGFGLWVVRSNSTSRSLVAALALGAQGVWMGSLWLTTEEAETHPVVKEKFLKASSSDTVRSRSLTGKPARQLRSAWTDAWEDPSNPDPLPMPLQPRLVREAQARIGRSAHKSPGAADLANYFVGQIVGSMNHVKSVRSVMEELVQDYADTMERLDEWARG